MNNLVALDDHLLIFPRSQMEARVYRLASAYLLSLPQSEILPEEQSELCQETHYG